MGTEAEFELKDHVFVIKLLIPGGGQNFSGNWLLGPCPGKRASQQDKMWFSLGSEQFGIVNVANSIGFSRIVHGPRFLVGFVVRAVT